MALTQVTITGTFQQSPGKPSHGSLQFQLSADLFLGGVPVANRAPIPVVLDATGSFSATVWANDDVGVSPAGSYWVLSGVVDGVGFSEEFVISTSMAPTVDLSQLTPAAVSNPVYPVNAVQLQGFAVSSTVPTPGQNLYWSGTAWSPGVLTGIDGGSASSTFKNYQIIDGGNASGS